MAFGFSVSGGIGRDTSGLRGSTVGGFCVRARGYVVKPRGGATRVMSQFNYNIYQDGEERSKRTVNPGERAVTLPKPLGLLLEEGSDGMVFVKEVTQGGSAADYPDEIRPGDVVVAVSATFGDEIWSTRGIGLDRVMKAIKVRSGSMVTLVLETPGELRMKQEEQARLAASRRDEARDKFGERQVLDPTSWTSSAPPQFDDQYATIETPLDSQLKEKLKAEIVAPYKQNWILWVSIASGILAIVMILVLGS
uniref:PDZ domain-containing protein n=1 Tax=Compsopogon caeruleus TaxID=31354 RepID=A0A7S1XFB7_9RHOD|eukprot:CAMPEP_0184678754 /NCGR_PEP_ID=MMETSP0312-20130426/1547_1 /TAXON_ID=31354 /ORGANISM="Compsopogon coeruleus, Strain SAG 36.94" /LENGTH=250 /DNA_ID=CAMNT_0027127737 /DNA_START=81 /DNA_END=833 /DNA_ORIENTATION=-